MFVLRDTAFLSTNAFFPLALRRPGNAVSKGERRTL
jgi:hypothetical protein